MRVEAESHSQGPTVARLLIDYLYCKHRMDLPCALGAAHTLIDHPPFDFAHLSVCAIKKDEPRHLDFHRLFENAPVATAAILFDDIEDLFSRLAVFLSRRDFDD